MRIILSIFILFTLSAHGQILYGLNNFHGLSNGGTMIRFDVTTNDLIVVKNFDNNSGQFLDGSMMQARDGKLYGITEYGGIKDYGVIFSFDPVTSTYTKLKEFDYPKEGINPSGGLIQIADGTFYGMTEDGGDNENGTIFSFKHSTYTKLYDFDGINGDHPTGPLTLASDGKFYGLTSAGGSANRGVIFSFDPTRSLFIKLKDLDFTTGASPFGSLIQASDGKLYGMTYSGGANNYGVIFSYDPSNATYKQLKDFDMLSGSFPGGDLLQASDGLLYGMTSAGGPSGHGIIFSFNPVSSVFTILKDFDQINGAIPTGTLIQASDGKLYGLTSAGGFEDGGIIFSYDPVTSSFSNLKNFDKSTGTSPVYGALVEVKKCILQKATVNSNSPVCIGDTLKLVSAGGDSYRWTGPNGFTSTEQNPIIVYSTPAINDIYTVTVSKGGCSDTTSNVSIKAKRCSFYIPGAFTPNADGKNDLFRPIIAGNVTNYKFSIFNRWGQKVFETKELNKGWNGMNENTSVFIWICEYQLQGQTRAEKGTVLLIK